MYNWDKRGNAPLYGVCFGVFTLFFASWVAHQQMDATQPPPPSAQASASN